MFRNIVCAIVIFLATVTLKAQQSKKGITQNCNCAFSSINQLGLMVGELNEAFQIQTINGFRYKSWVAGVGIGLDEYRFRSVPFFLNLRKELWIKPNTPFLYNDIGLNFPWVKNNQKVYFASGDFKKGFYYDAGLGYKITLRKQALIFSAGFSLKQLKEIRPSYSCPFGAPCSQEEDVYKYSLKRVSLKLGIQL